MAQQKAVSEESFTGVSTMTTGAKEELFTPDYPAHTYVPNSSPFLDLKPLNTKIKSAKLYALLNLGDNYNLGGNQFNLTVNFSVAVKDGTGSTIINQPGKALSINQDAPEIIYVFDFFNDIESVREFEIIIDSYTLTPSAADNPLINDLVSQNAKLKCYYEIEYQTDVRTASSIPEPIPNNINPVFNSRVHIFDWSHTTHNFPNYEFELLRLHNISEDTDSDPSAIRARVDWSKALRIETQSDAKSVKLTVAEGTGFYIWRVRPVGNYYDGGIANFQNWGEWSPAPPSGDILNLTKGLVDGSNTLCYFTDPDENINWIYGRTFTEGNRTSEKITYANGLTQQKQTQAYLQSTGTTLVSQTITDFSGRPALTTIPAPVVESAMDKYKRDFVINSSTKKVYTAQDFDNDNALNNPAMVDSSSGSPYSYYSDNNSNLNIPSANGYPYSRNVFYNDGTGRVKEQAGPGKIHALGLQSDGKGRTTRTFYGTPSDEELIRIFGDEAPAATSVFKTITVDANNTESITYTSKEGKVIATCLVKSTGNNLDPLPSESDGSTNFEVNNKITVNVPAPNGFISTKRLSFSSSTTVEIGYRMECENIFLCPPSDGSCQYRVQLFIHNVSDNISYTSGELPLPECAGGFRTLGTITWTPLQAGDPALSTDANNNPVLPPGNYIIEKRIYTAPDAQANTASAGMQDVEKGIKPLVDKVLGMLDAVTNEDELIQFYTDIEDLGEQLENQNDDGNLTYTISGLEELTKNVENSISLSPAYAPGAIPPTKPAFLNLKAGCCKSMSIPIRYTPPAKCYTTAELEAYYTANSSGTDKGFMLDFEGYAKTMLNPFLEKKSAESGETIDVVFADLFPGYDLASHDFNLMIYHMLTDKYYTGQSKWVSGTRVQENGDPIVDEVQYECRKLWNCWINVVNQFENAQELNDNGEDNHNVAKGADAASDETPSTDPPEDDNTNTVNKENDKNAQDSPGLPQWLLDWILDRKLRKELRKDRSINDEQPKNAFTANLAKLFLECAGYKFAEIIPVGDSPSFYSDPLYESDIATVTRNLSDAVVNPGKPTYPYIVDAKYAFKYFAYTSTDGNPNQRNDPDFPAYIELEVPVCYDTPPADLCIKPACAGRTHVNWSASERDNFYKEINGYMPAAPMDVTETELKTCPDIVDMEQQLTDVISSCTTNCSGRRTEFRNEVVQMFLDNCYVIGGCAEDNNVVTEKDIDAIVDGIIADCQKQCADIELRVKQLDPFDGTDVVSYSELEADFNDPTNATTASAPYPKCYTRQCTAFNATTYAYEEITYAEGLILPRCERERIDQVKTWSFVVQMPQTDSKCDVTKLPPEPEWWKNDTGDPCLYQEPDSPAGKYSKAYEVQVTVPPVSP